MITKNRLDICILEAERFIQKAHEAKKRFLQDSMSIYGCAETGACRRASMDLTRALAQLRSSKP